MKKTLFVLLSAVVITVSNAQNPSGNCGKDGGSNLRWELNLSTGEMVIQGSGEMDQFSGGSVPWKKYSDDIKSVTFPKGMNNIGNYAFSGCDNLTTISFPSSVKEIGYYSFSDCGLTSVTIPSTVTFVDLNAFQSCHSLKTVVIQSTMPENSNKIAGYTFYYCDALESVTIAEGIKILGEQAFGSCTALKEITLPSTMYIMDEAFSGCSGLESITCKAGTPPICHNSVFKNVTKSIPVYVPNASLDAYKSDPWEGFTNILPITATTINQTTDGQQTTTDKILHNGQLYILRDGKTFNALGATVK